MSEPDSSTAARRKQAAASLLRDMETAAARMRELIVSMPPQDLLGYLYAQYMLKVMFARDGGAEAEEPSESAEPDDLINDNQFLLEYVHAVLASDPLPEQVDFDEAKCTELYDVSLMSAYWMRQTFRTARHHGANRLRRISNRPQARCGRVKDTSASHRPTKAMICEALRIASASKVQLVTVRRKLLDCGLL